MGISMKTLLFYALGAVVMLLASANPALAAAAGDCAQGTLGGAICNTIFNT